MIIGGHQRNLAVQEFTEHQCLGRALLEGAKIDHAGGDDLAHVNGGDPSNWHENSATAGDFNNDPQHARLSTDTHRDDNITNTADLIAIGGKDRHA